LILPLFGQDLLALWTVQDTPVVTTWTNGLPDRHCETPSLLPAASYWPTATEAWQRHRQRTR
jgi:hypothetical protein